MLKGEKPKNGCTKSENDYYDPVLKGFEDVYQKLTCFFDVFMLFIYYMEKAEVITKSERIIILERLLNCITDDQERKKSIEEIYNTAITISDE